MDSDAPIVRPMLFDAGVLLAKSLCKQTTPAVTSKAKRAKPPPFETGGGLAREAGISS